MFVWDEKKRQTNLRKHRLDSLDAALVYEKPDKLTLKSFRHGEERYVDIAVIEVADTCLTLVYLESGEDIRIISFRNASRKERRLYEDFRQPD